MLHAGTIRIRCERITRMQLRAATRLAGPLRASYRGQYAAQANENQRRRIGATSRLRGWAPSPDLARIEGAPSSPSANVHLHTRTPTPPASTPRTRLPDAESLTCLAGAPPPHVPAAATEPSPSASAATRNCATLCATSPATAGEATPGPNSGSNLTTDVVAELNSGD